MSKRVSERVIYASASVLERIPVANTVQEANLEERERNRDQ